MRLPEAHAMYVARTYGYVACGKHGLVILDLENPEEPKIDQVFTAGGSINDLHDVKLGVTYNSEFAYLADGKNGLKVVQLTGPKTPGNNGFSPKPTPELIATYKLPAGGHALAIPRAVDRDRAIDEAGNQLAVFGRIGARPLNVKEQQKMFVHDKKLWRVEDDPKSDLYRYVRPPEKKEPVEPKRNFGTGSWPPTGPQACPPGVAQPQQMPPAPSPEPKDIPGGPKMDGKWPPSPQGPPACPPGMGQQPQQQMPPVQQQQQPPPPVPQQAPPPAQLQPAPQPQHEQQPPLPK
jgi:hypothetical protein